MIYLTSASMKLSNIFPLIILLQLMIGYGYMLYAYSYEELTYPLGFIIVLNNVCIFVFLLFLVVCAIVDSISLFIKYKHYFIFSEMLWV